MAEIGFIGLGHMGLPMAACLIKAGHHVLGFDRDTARMDALEALGGRVAADLEAVTHHQTILITMLQTGEQVKSVCCGDAGIFQKLSSGTLFIDCSTIDVETARLVHLQAKQAGLTMVDAPVSGGVAGAEDGRLTFMVGGSDAAFEAAQPILLDMGKTVIHAGPAGNGVAAKICNNMLLGVSMIAVSEAFLLAEKLGLSPQKLHEIATHASGNSWVLETYVPVPNVLQNVPANRNYAPGFTSAMMLKDLCLAGDVAEAVGVRAVMGEGARTRYAEALERIETLDFSAIIEFIREESFK